MSDKENSFETYVEENPIPYSKSSTKKPDYLEIENLKATEAFKKIVQSIIFTIYPTKNLKRE